MRTRSWAHLSSNITYNGKCEQEITTEHECRVAAENNQIASGDIDGYGGRRDGEHYPPGCYLYSRTYYFNRYPESKAGCNPWMPCVCKTDTCFPCSNSTYNDEYAVNAKCKRCLSGKYHFSSGATSSNACVNAPGIPKVWSWLRNRYCPDAIVWHLRCENSEL